MWYSEQYKFFEVRENLPFLPKYPMGPRRLTYSETGVNSLGTGRPFTQHGYLN